MSRPDLWAGRLTPFPIRFQREVLVIDRPGLAASSRGAPDERGATATEYGVLVGFLAIALVAGVLLFGTSLRDYFDWLTEAVADAWTADGA